MTKAFYEIKKRGPNTQLRQFALDALSSMAQKQMVNFNVVDKQTKNSIKYNNRRLYQAEI